MVKLANTFSRLNPIDVLVVGDLMLDTYTTGKARRISPEAPVAVVHVQQEEHRPGGAGNVALNLVSLGARVVLMGRVGKDWAGETLYAALKQEGVDLCSVVVQDTYKTPVKNRIISDSQQIVRIDHEQILSLSEPLEQTLIESIPSLLQGIKVMAISDYGKGFLTSTLLNALIHRAKATGILVITDPKGHDFIKYQGTTVIKPNLSEAYAAANLSLDTPLDLAAKKILQMVQADLLMITRSEAGLSLFDAAGQRHDFPVHIKQVKDVTGAGDTVLAMLTCALANDLSYEEAAHLCNMAASLAIEHVGCARITLSDLAHRLLESNINNKVFDEEHLFALKQVLKRRAFNLLAIFNTNTFSAELFSTIKQLAQSDSHLLIYVNESESEASELFIDMLASLKETDFILIHLESLKRVCEKVNPVNSYYFENKEFKHLPHFSVLLEAHQNYK